MKPLPCQYSMFVNSIFRVCQLFILFNIVFEKLGGLVIMFITEILILILIKIAV